MAEQLIPAQRTAISKESTSGPAGEPLSERSKKLREFRAKSDALAAAGMPVLTQDQVNEEVAKLRGNGPGAL
jgi:hypothetical protein